MKISDVKDCDISALRKYPTKIKDLTECSFAAIGGRDIKCSYCGGMITAGSKFWYSRRIDEFNSFRNDYMCQKCCYNMTMMDLEDIGYIWIAENFEDEITFCR